MSDKALHEAERERAAAERERQKSKATEEWRQREEKARQSAENCKETLQRRYRHVFIGVAILTITLAVLNAYNNRNVLAECGQWFIDRWKNTVTIAGMLQGAYISLSDIIGKQLPKLTEVWRYTVTSAVMLATAIVVIILLRLILTSTKRLRKKHSQKLREAFRNELKVIINIAMAISLFYCCLFFYEPITSFTTINIFSVWIILSTTTTFLIFFPDIISM